jgi:F-type H+-transporting ATPase subunit gamma
MTNLRDVRLRMRAIEQTLQVTKAMNLISTAKLRKGRRALQDTKPYFDRIQKSVFDILSDAGEIKSVFFRKKNPSGKYRTAIIVITSDRGLAGGYNANIFRQVKELCSKVENPMLVFIGAVGYRHFDHLPYTILEYFPFCSQVPTVEYAKEISKYITTQYLWEVYDEIHIVYTHMFSSVKVVPVERQIIPLDKEKIQSDIMWLGNKKRIDLQFEFLPSVGEVFDALVPIYMKGVLYCCMVEAYASEQSARMSAMDEASKSAEEMLATLRIKYNRARQSSITQEISEVVGGSAALSGR